MEEGLHFASKVRFSEGVVGRKTDETEGRSDFARETLYTVVSGALQA